MIIVVVDVLLHLANLLVDLIVSGWRLTSLPPRFPRRLGDVRDHCGKLRSRMYGSEFGLMGSSAYIGILGDMATLRG